MNNEHEADRRQDEIRERFEREADIVRGLGGVVTTDDMRAYGEQMAYAALMDHPVSPFLWSEEEDLYCDEVNVEWYFAHRHDADVLADLPDGRNSIRAGVRRIRALRLSLGQRS